jgi:hypothetical protein
MTSARRETVIPAINQPQAYALDSRPPRMANKDDNHMLIIRQKCDCA